MRTWFVEEEVTGNSNATLQLQWPASVQRTDFVPASARLEHYNTTTNKWDAGIAVTGASSSDGGTTYAINRSGITSFSPFAVSSRAGGVLPVVLTRFAARREPTGGVLCEWQTAQEVNNDRFVIERSTTGQDFLPIGTVKGTGPSSVSQQYQYVDAQPPVQTAYYRLRQLDMDGTEAFSSVVTVATVSGTAPVVLTPNPGTGLYQVVLPGASSMVQAEVLNVVGARVQSVGSDGRIDLQQQPNGVYIVRIHTAQGLKTIRLIKQ